MRDLSFKEHQGRESVDTVFLGFFIVVDFDKGYIILVAFVVNVLQLGKYFLTLLLIFVVCKKKSRATISSISISNPNLPVKLTEEYRDVWHLFNNQVQHFVSDVFDLVALLLMI